MRHANANAVIRVYDEAGNLIETHGHNGDFKVAAEPDDAVRRKNESLLRRD